MIAGSGEAQEGDGPYRDKIVRYGETGPDAVAEKMQFVMRQMEHRMATLDAGWPMVTATQVYTVHDIHPSLARDIVAKGAASHGITRYSVDRLWLGSSTKWIAGRCSTREFFRCEFAEPSLNGRPEADCGLQVSNP